jgi:hypothetical protein
METDVFNTSCEFNPLLDFLTTEGYTSDEVAELLDELLFDYAQLNLIVQQADLPAKVCVHEKADMFHYWIRALRDAIQQCSF